MSESKVTFNPDVAAQAKIKAAKVRVIGLANKLLKAHSVDDFPFPGKVVEINTKTDSLEVAFQKLLDSHISSAPVWDPEAEAYVGVLDTQDMVKYIVKVHALKKHKASDLPTFFTEMRNDIAESRRLIGTPLKEVVHLSESSPAVTIDVGEALLDGVRLLKQTVLGVPIRRILVSDPETRRIVKVISQSAVIRTLAEELPKNGPVMEVLATETVESTGLGSTGVYTCKASAQALEALELMDEHQVSGVPVVNDLGVMVAHLSKSDMQAVSQSHGMHGIVGKSVLDLVRAARAIADDSKEADVDLPVITVPLDASIAKCIRELASRKVHRLYVADADGKPVRVVSLKDILRLLVL